MNSSSGVRLPYRLEERERRFQPCSFRINQEGAEAFYGQSVHQSASFKINPRRFRIILCKTYDAKISFFKLGRNIIQPSTAFFNALG